MQKEQRLIYRKGGPEKPGLGADNPLGRFNSLSFDEVGVDISKERQKELYDAAKFSRIAAEAKAEEEAAAEAKADTELAALEAESVNKSEFVEEPAVDGNGEKIDWLAVYTVGDGGEIKASGADFHALIVENHGPDVANLVNLSEGEDPDCDVAEWDGGSNCYRYSNGSKVYLKHGRNYTLSAQLY
ncbi:hypothetical protein HOE67_05360 [Candidatus Peregrinibacteria bacterium]|jgi:hypothetical protein|nr:hypothetical protein [Candidatus Peregrinibacteria bacterium]MBT4056511.1 hypothetical protein [Candidatus Peregrinibacteria bacterium]